MPPEQRDASVMMDHGVRNAKDGRRKAETLDTGFVPQNAMPFLAAPVISHSPFPSHSAVVACHSVAS